MRNKIAAACMLLITVTTVADEARDKAQAPEYTRQRYAELTRHVLKTKYDIYCALLYVAGDDPAKIAEGEKMIRRRIDIGRSGIGFMNVDIVLAYSLFKDKFTPEGQKQIAGYIKNMINPGGWHYRNRFVHLNDNWPFLTCYAMIIGGEAIGRDSLVNEAIVRLETYLDMYRDTGLVSEYNSPTYSPLSLFCLEAVAGLSKSLRARVAARVISERLWSEIALRFHAPSSQFAAPHSRAYARDTLGVKSSLAYTLYPLLPGGVLLDRVNFPKLSDGIQEISENSLIRHFFDPYLAAIAENKTFPYLVQARLYRPFRVEGPDRWPGGFFDTLTYMTARYAVGSAQRTFCGGNGTTPFQIHWTRSTKATKPGDARTLYTRYRLNDELPPDEKSGLLAENGYVHPLQYRNTTIVLYRPKLANNGKMNRLCASALIPLPKRLDAVYIGYPPKKVEALPVSMKKPTPVFIEDGKFYLALHPLTVTDRGRQEAMRVEEAAQHLIVSFYNLQIHDEGKSEKPSEESEGTLSTATWDEQKFLETRNGFVIEVGDALEYGSFGNFVKKVGNPKLKDVLKDGIRTISYSRPGRSMKVSQRVTTHEYLARTYDGNEYIGPLLRSPHTAATLDATLKVADAVLSSNAGEQKWLTVEPTTGSYVVLYPFRWPFPLDLSTPKGEVHCKRFRVGRLVYQPGPTTRLTIDCRLSSPVRFTKPDGPFIVVLNDEDVTAKVKTVDDGYLEVPVAP